MYSAAKKQLGFHGTYIENLQSILDNNFHESENHNIWIGDGVYFFVEGVGLEKPVDLAKQYAIDKCFDKSCGKYTKRMVCVLEATIKVNDDNFLDLTRDEGIRLFNKFRGGITNKIEGDGYRPNKEYQDVDVFKIMRNVLGIEFVKVDVYIRFGIERKNRSQSQIPNVTIFVVNNPKKNILRPSIKVVCKESSV